MSFSPGLLIYLVLGLVGGALGVKLKIPAGALIGAIVLEELDLLVDCGTQSLYPREPDSILTEIE